MIERRALASMEPYIPGKKLPGTIKLSSNENPLGSSPKAVDAANVMLAESHRYPDKLVQELREALAQKHGVSSDRIIVGNGSDEVMVLAGGAFVEAGSEVITARHTFSQYAFAARLYDGILVETDMPELRFDLSAIQAAVTKNTRLIFLCNPNNPTGSYFTHSELEKLLSSVPSSVLVVVDEAYADYADASDFPRSGELLERYSNLLVLRTFSKIYGLAGLRVGYGVGSSRIIAALDKVRQPFNVNLLAQTAARAALWDKEFVAESQRMTAVGREFLYGELERLGVTYLRSQSNFIYVEVPEDARSFVDRIAEGGVSARPLNSFGLPRAIRITVGTAENNELFVHALETALGAAGVSPSVTTP